MKKRNLKSVVSDFLNFHTKIFSNEKGEISDDGAESDSSSDDSGMEEESSIEPSSDSEEISEPSEGEISVSATNEQELEQEIKEAIEDGASEEEVKNMIRQYTLKVDGKEFVKELDLNNEEEIIRQLQLAAKGQKSMQELQELKKLYQEELNNILSDPFKALKQLDPDFDPIEASARYLDEVLKEQEMDPEEKERLRIQKEFEEIKAERDRLKKEAEDKAREQEMAALAAEIENDIMGALSEDPDLIADRETVALVAENLHWAAKKGIDVSAKDVLPTVKRQLQENFQKSASRFKSTAALKQYMGNDLLEKLREERVKQQAEKQVKNINNVQNVKKPEDAKKEESKKIKLSSLFS